MFSLSSKPPDPVTTTITTISTTSTINETKHQQNQIGFECPKNHGLTFDRTYQDRFKCDACANYFPTNWPMYGCRTCDWGICERCYSRPVVCPEKHLLLSVTNVKKKKKMSLINGIVANVKNLESMIIFFAVVVNIAFAPVVIKNDV